MRVGFQPTIRFIPAALFALCLAVPAFAQRGAVTRPQNLAELVDEAAVVIRGHVLSARVEPHPEFKSLRTLVVTLQVDETLKGSPADTFTFRQFIWDIRDVFDTAGYRPGQHLLLMLIKPSAYGLSSPAGLDQGRFRILQDSAGNQIAVNGHGNAALFQGLSTQMKTKGAQLSSRLAGMLEQPAPGPVPLEDLRALIQQIVKAK